MPAIKIANIADPRDSAKDYKYSDLTLDVELNDLSSPNNLHKPKSSTDIQVSYDELAIKNALINLFNTTPGEKLLTPEFGIDLKRFLFDPLTDMTANLIGQTIYKGITRWEPRVKILNIKVIKDIDNRQFEITLSIAIPKLSNRKVVLTGILNKENFTSTQYE